MSGLESGDREVTGNIKMVYRSTNEFKFVICWQLGIGRKDVCGRLKKQLTQMNDSFVLGHEEERGPMIPVGFYTW